MLLTRPTALFGHAGRGRDWDPQKLGGKNSENPADQHPRNGIRAPTELPSPFSTTRGHWEAWASCASRSGRVKEARRGALRRIRQRSPAIWRTRNQRHVRNAWPIGNARRRVKPPIRLCPARGVNIGVAHAIRGSANDDRAGGDCTISPVWCPADVAHADGRGRRRRRTGLVQNASAHVSSQRTITLSKLPNGMQGLLCDTGRRRSVMARPQRRSGRRKRWGRNVLTHRQLAPFVPPDLASEGTQVQ